MTYEEKINGRTYAREEVSAVQKRVRELVSGLAQRPELALEGPTWEALIRFAAAAEGARVALELDLDLVAEPPPHTDDDSPLCIGGDGLCPEFAEADGYCDQHHPSVTQRDDRKTAIDATLEALGPGGRRL